MDLFSDTKTKTIEPNVKQSMALSFTTRSPLLQIDSLGGGAGNETVTKKIYQIFDGIEYPVAIPEVSANALRGILRRNSFEQIVKIGVREKGKIKLSPTVINFNTTGGSSGISSFNNLTYKQEVAIREKLPHVSLFGAGLSSVEGKIAITELRPTPEFCIRQDKDGNIAPKALIKKMGGIRKNDGNSSHFGYLISEEDAKNFAEQNDARSKVSKELKALLDKEKASKSKSNSGPQLTKSEEERKIELQTMKEISQQMLFESEYVPMGVEFRASIAPKKGFELTQIEQGMLYKALQELQSMQLGSLKNKGYGVGDWIIASNDGEMSSIADASFYLGPKTESISEGMLTLIRNYENYVIENKLWENLDIDNLIKNL